MASGGSVPQFASLYVGDLHPDVTEAILYEIFNAVGPVGSIRICRDSVTKKSLGYGYVNFHSVSDAERALDTLNYSSIKGRACRIMWSQRDPSLRKSGVGNIFVKNLDKSIDNKALYDTFSLFGNILSCKVACDAGGKSRGYGFVHYETEEAAKQAIERVNNMQIGERQVQVQSFLPRNDRSAVADYTNIYAKNLPSDFSSEKLDEMFGKFGTITSSCILEDKNDRKFCFVNYDKTESAKKAVEELNGKDTRTDEQKQEKKEGEEEEKPEDYLMYVSRAQTKAERVREFREKNAAADSGAPKRAQGVNLYVKNLDEATDDAALRELFEPFGAITSAVAVKDDKDNCKGFGFVCYSTPDEATKAVTEMHLKVVKGKPLYVGLAEKKDQRQERLRQRYAPGAGGMGPMGKGMGKDMGKDMGKGGKGGMMGGMGGMGMGMGGMGMGMGGMGMGPQGGMGMGPQGGMGMGTMGMGMGGPQMMGMMGKGGAMTAQQMSMMGKGGMPGCGGKGPMGMMGPGMMGMMGGKGPMGTMNPQMMGMMGGKGPLAGGMMNPMMTGMMGGKGPMGMTGPMGPMGMMRPMMPMGGMPSMMGGKGVMGMTGQPQQGTPLTGPGNLTAAALAAAPPGVQKQMLGEKLYPMVSKMQPELAGKITGMMLEMDNSELLILLESEPQLKVKVDEAMRVLQAAK